MQLPKLPFQNTVAEGLISKIDINALAKEAISKVDKHELATAFVNAFKAEVEHLQAQDPAHPGQTYGDEAAAHLATIEQSVASLLQVLEQAHVIK